MFTALPKDDPELREAFETILSIDSLSPHVIELAKLIHDAQLSTGSINLLGSPKNRY